MEPGTSAGWEWFEVEVEVEIIFSRRIFGKGTMFCLVSTAARDHLKEDLKI